MKEMDRKKLKDSEAKSILLGWPASTGDLWPPPQDDGRWIRGQPIDGKSSGPRIISPGAKLFSTQPDGLFVYFNGTGSCDLVVIEVCGSIQNLNDKRSRYIPSSHSLLLMCRKKWLHENIRVKGGGNKPRWEVAGTLPDPPEVDLTVPIRHLRVLYALPNAAYKQWCPEHTPTGYEYFCPHSSLAGYNSQKMQSFLRRMSVASQFYTDPAKTRI